MTAILTEVTASLPDDRADEVEAAFAAILSGPIPAGLVRTELLRGPEGRWRIQSLWRDTAALDAMRSLPDPPAAPTMFRTLGVEPSVRMWIVQISRNLE